MTLSANIGSGFQPQTRTVTLGAQVARVGLVLPAGSPNMKFSGITGGRILDADTGALITVLTPLKFGDTPPPDTDDIFFADSTTFAVNKAILIGEKVEVTYRIGTPGGKSVDAAAVAALIPPA